MKSRNCKLQTANWLLALAAFCLLPSAFCFAQGTPGTVRCPSQVDTADSLFRVADGPRTNLSASVGTGATTIAVNSTIGFPESGSIKIDNEIIFYIGTSPTSFTGAIRAQSGTVAAAHSDGALVTAPIIAAHHNTLAQALICAQEKALAAQPGDADLTAIANLTPTNNDLLQRKSGAWTNRTPAQVKTDLSLTKSDVGLGNVVNVDTSTTANIADSTNKRFVTDDQLGIIENTECASLPAGTVLITCPPYNADKTGVADASAAIQAAVDSGAQTILTGSGTFLISQARLTAVGQPINYFFGHPNLNIVGAGEGKTIFTVPNGVTYNNNTLVRISNGRHQGISRVTFQGPASYTSGNLTVIGVSFGATETEVNHVEITGWSADGPAGATLIGLYRDATELEIDTTLGTTIAAGTRTVTPGSMKKITVGKRLTIGGTT
jgi:hypothetical protein